MDYLPDQIETDETLLALQNLVFSGTPKEVAENFKDQGNECFKKGKKYYKSAISFYTQGIQQDFDDIELRALLYSNRAAVHLQFENYGHVIDDSLESVKISPSVKAYYRLAKAYFTLKRYDDAIINSEEGLKLEPDNKTLKKIIKDSNIEKEKIIKRQEDEKRKVEEIKNKKELLVTAIHIKGIILGVPFISNISSYLEKSSIYLDDNNLTHWPVLFLYEEYLIIDFIKDFCEEDTFELHLQRMFPGDEFPDWDTNRKYIYNTLDIYTIVNHTAPIIPETKERKRKRKVKINRSTKLIKVLQHPEFVIPGIPVFYIFRKETKAKTLFLETLIDDLGNYAE